MNRSVFYLKLCMLFVILFLGSCTGNSSSPQLATDTALVGKLTFAGSTTLQPLIAQIGDTFQKENPEVKLDIAAGGSVVGIQAVHEGTVDIGMSSRALSAEELQGINAYKIAADVIAVVVHPRNPAQTLTMEQLRDIYMGRITNWQEVGGDDQPIIPVVREKSSGTRGAFDELALEKKEPSAPELYTAVTAGDVAAYVSNNPTAIGYLGFGNIESSMKVLKIEGVLPSNETAISGAYPLIRPLILLTGPLSQPLATRFIEFVLSAEGQRLVSEFGWVPVK